MLSIESTFESAISSTNKASNSVHALVAPKHRLSSVTWRFTQDANKNAVASYGTRFLRCVPLCLQKESWFLERKVCCKILTALVLVRPLLSKCPNQRPLWWRWIAARPVRRFPRAAARVAIRVSLRAAAPGAPSASDVSGTPRPYGRPSSCCK